MPRTPIEPYARLPVTVRPHDPRGFDVAARLVSVITSAWPGAVVEHVGSSAVPGLAGKGVIDLMVVPASGEVAAVAEALVAVGFQRQTGPHAFPPNRPLLLGTIRHDGDVFRTHVHIIPADRSEVAETRSFRDALRADPALRAEYTALKHAIVGQGITEGVAFSEAKAEWIAAVLDRLGVRRPPGERD